MSSGKGAGRRNRGVTDMSAPLLDAEPPWRPNLESADEHPFSMPIDAERQIVGRQCLDGETGQFIEFNLTAQVRRSGTWHDIARVDTKHQTVHLHILSKTGDTLARRELRKIDGPRDVDAGWVDGVKILVEDWEEHERRWRSGR